MVEMSYFFERRAARVPLPQHGFPNKSMRKTGLLCVAVFSDVTMFTYGDSMLCGTMPQTDRRALCQGIDKRSGGGIKEREG